ncbi:MAG TPA: hypothetical protein VE029_01940 [Rhizobacter sp.]|nr:hypothetical protein [Rhizobacter sp.]
MSFVLLSLVAIAIVTGFLVLLATLIIHPHVNALIQGDWTPEERAERP